MPEPEPDRPIPAPGDAPELASLTAALARFFGASQTPGVIAAYLYGSHAGGRAHRESDVDVAILLDRDLHPSARDRFELRVTMGSELIEALNENRIDLVVLNDLPPLFARKILYEGRRVHCADPVADRSFLVKTQLVAADLAPWLERVRRRKLEALRR